MTPSAYMHVVPSLEQVSHRIIILLSVTMCWWALCRTPGYILPIIRLVESEARPR